MRGMWKKVGLRLVVDDRVDQLSGGLSRSGIIMNKRIHAEISTHLAKVRVHSIHITTGLRPCGEINRPLSLKMTEGVAEESRRLVEVNIETLNWLGYIFTCEAVRRIYRRAVLSGIFAYARSLH
jgi:hypothetical protein